MIVNNTSVRGLHGCGFCVYVGGLGGGGYHWETIPKH